MRYSWAVAGFAVLLAGNACAQTLPPVPRSSTVPTAQKRQVGFFYFLNADCSSAGDIDSRLTKAPANGTVELDEGLGYSTFTQDNQRYSCNGRPVMGVRVFYTSKDGYVGKDAFTAEFLSPNGQDYVWKYSVTVK
jgi:hypothetical protein